ncbi:hypothetical protein A8O29_015115 [Scandinavium goeteborgense]|nr:hypothetical protein [Scandinavium goeteborgense]QKN82553.1 hypothetical protein A8O29_015115 [Scandinavium goeteborgense]
MSGKPAYCLDTGSLVDGGQVTVALDTDANALTYDFQAVQKRKPEAAH